MIKINESIINIVDFNRLKCQLISEVLRETCSDIARAKRLKLLLKPIFKEEVCLSVFIKDIIDYDETNSILNSKYNISEYLKMIDFYEEAFGVTNKDGRYEVLSKIYTYVSDNEHIGIRGFVPDYLILNNLGSLNEEITNDSNYKSFLKDTLFKVFIEFSIVCKELFNYEKFISSKPIRASILVAMDIEICPYCNESLIHTINDEDDEDEYEEELRVLADVDHFLLQSKVPLFSLTFSNFIPSCYVCNRGLKGQSMKKILNPQKSGFEDKAVFFLDNPIITGDASEVRVKLKINVPEGSEEYNRIHNSKRLFKLERRYNHPSIKDMIVQLHTDTYKLSQGSLDSYGYIFRETNTQITFEDIYCHIFRFAPDTNDFINIRLGKLKSDLFNINDFRRNS